MTSETKEFTSPTDRENQEIAIQALELAIRVVFDEDTAESIRNRAAVFRDFILGKADE